MEEEFEPKKIVRKIEDEIRKEVKQELVEEQKSANKKRRIGVIILRAIFVIIFLVFLANTVIGVLSVQKVDKNEKPIWYINSKTTKSGNKTELTYNLGLYVIVKTTEGREIKTTLKPFFLK